MKKLLSSLLILLVLAIPVCAAADLIWIPENRFFIQHKNECFPFDGIYEAVKDTYSYDQPGGEADSEINAGKTVNITHKWYGTEHGPAGIWGLLDWNDSWINLKDFRRLYDVNDFLAAHRSELLSAYGNLVFDVETPYIEWIMVPEEISEFTSGQRINGEYKVVFWPFPGSDKPGSQYYRSSGSKDRISFDTVYRDEAGNLWLHFEGYYYGRLDSWLYLNDFSSDDPPYVTAHYADEVKKNDAPLPAGFTGPKGPGGTQPPVLPLMAAALVTLTAAALLIVMKPKKEPTIAG